MGWRARRPVRQADGREAPAGEHVLIQWERRRRGAAGRAMERAGQVGTLGCASSAAHNGNSVCCVAGGTEPKRHGVGR
eukprot:3526498-Prymnesium_polylepis.1